MTAINAATDYTKHYNQIMSLANSCVQQIEEMVTKEFTECYAAKKAGLPLDKKKVTQVFVKNYLDGSYEEKNARRKEILKAVPDDLHAKIEQIDSHLKRFLFVHVLDETVKKIEALHRVDLINVLCACESKGILKPVNLRHSCVVQSVVYKAICPSKL